jgi:arylsulfatase A-like enzyme
MRMPPIVRWPGVVPSGTVCQHPAAVVDLPPTFLRAAGVPLPWPMHGHDLSPILRDPRADWPHPVLLEHFGLEFGAATDRVGGTEAYVGIPWWLSLRQGKYKYIRTLIQNEVEELYDLEADADERTNLALEAKHNRTLADYRQRLRAELTRTKAGLVGNLPTPRTAP